jgi:Predicted nucleoside-diphosphate-sugar epimerases
MKNKTLKIIITGASGMVGEGVLTECLKDNRIDAVLSLSRKPLGITHPKLKELVLPDLHDLTDAENHLSGYDTCLYCLGTTSVGKSEEQYAGVTYELTMSVATVLSRLNSDMIFCYISALGADNTEKSKVMWARVKGKTENALSKLQFGNFYAFRPQLLTPNKDATHTHRFYKYISWFFPLGRLLFPDGFCTLQELAKSMINVGISGFPKTVITPRDMVNLAKEIN